MEVSWRFAEPDDVPRLVELYGPALAEQVELRKAWAFAEGFAVPVEDSVRKVLADDDSFLAVGLIDGCVFGFIWARIEDLLPQAGGERMGVIRMVYVAPPAREVGVGEAMLVGALSNMRAQGVRRFDAVVSPGHRLAKNFFESAGFAARRITMYHDDGADD